MAAELKTYFWVCRHGTSHGLVSHCAGSRGYDTAAERDAQIEPTKQEWADIAAYMKAIRGVPRATLDTVFPDSAE